MPEHLSDRARATVLHATRTMFPHDVLPDEAYEKVVRAIDATAADGDVAATVEAGAADLDASGPFVELGDDAQLEALRRIEGSDFFKLVHSTAIVELYDNPLVWRIFGYEGPSVHAGGYLHRGFDDLDWLPEPELVSMPEDESPAAATPETTAKFDRSSDDTAATPA